MMFSMMAMAAMAATVDVRLEPARICVDPRTGYPNFDIMLTNAGDAEAAITEIRGAVIADDGEVIERRIVWQDALSASRPDAKVPAKAHAVLFNPIAFRHAAPGRRMRFEVDFDNAPSARAEAVPVDCAAAQPILRMPIAGRVLVYDGYDVLSHHRRSDFRGELGQRMGITGNFQRFALDLVVADREGRLWRGNGKTTADWLGWGQPVRSAAAGTVAAFHDGQADNVEIGTVDKWGGPKIEDPMSSYGNYVLIDHGQGEFTLYGHMREGSIAIRKGDRVAAGQRIGAIGNSGSSGGVHLHWERRRGTGFGLAGIETQPIYVTGVSLVGDGGSTGPLAIDTGDVLISE